MYAKLPKWELVFYFFYWLSLFSNCVYHFYLYCRELEQYDVFVNWALDTGFFMNLPYKEKLDNDILVIYELGISYLVIGAVHTVLRRVVVVLFGPDKPLLWFLAVYGFVGFSYLVGHYFGLFLLALVACDWIVVQKVLAVLPFTRNMSPLCRAWIIAVSQTVSLHSVARLFDGYTDSYLARIAFVYSVGWYQLKLISYTDFNSRYKTGFLHFVAYSFYFPTILAPYHSYTRFLYNNKFIPLEEVDSSTIIETPSTFGGKLKLFVKQYLFIMMWLIITIFANHSFYPTALAFYQSAYLSSSLWSRPGHLWVFGQWFQAKYMILYGFPWLISFVDTGVPLPDVPVFISRIYRYSVMWRRFDTGLYEFMRDHLYRPALSTLDYLVERYPSRYYSPFHHSPTFRKVIALAATYFFVGIWHGLGSGCLIFAAMNYIGLILEFAAAGISHKYRIAEKMSPLAYRRLTALISCFSVQWSWISFLFFMTDKEYGSFILYNLYWHPIYLHFIGMFAVYCWVHMAMELEVYFNGTSGSKKVKESPSADASKAAVKKRK